MCVHSIVVRNIVRKCAQHPRILVQARVHARVGWLISISVIPSSSAQPLCFPACVRRARMCERMRICVSERLYVFTAVCDVHASVYDMLCECRWQSGRRLEIDVCICVYGCGGSGGGAAAAAASRL